jgi:hypothetical protein
MGSEQFPTRSSALRAHHRGVRTPNMQSDVTNVE